MLGMNAKWKVFYTSLQPHGGYTDDNVFCSHMVAIPMRRLITYQLSLPLFIGSHLHIILDITYMLLRRW